MDIDISKKRILLVVPTHNREDELRHLLFSLTKLDCENIDFQIAIVDDGSTPPIREGLEGDFKGLNIVFSRNETHRGPAYCRNAVAGNFEGDYVWFLDSDTEIINSKTLIAMVGRLESDEHMAGTGGAIEEFQGEKRIVELDFLRNFLFVCRDYPPWDYSPSYVKGIGSNNLILKRPVFQLVGGFQETLARDEDNNLCLTARGLGYRFYQDADTVVLHKFSSSGRKSGAFEYFIHPRLYLRKMFETRIALILKHKPWLLLILPLMDAILVPMVFYHVSRGTYTGRAATLASRESLSRAAWFYLLFIQSLKSYVSGFYLFVKRFFSPAGRIGNRKGAKNLFLSRIDRTDRVYTIVSRLPGSMRYTLAKHYTDFMKRRIINRGFPDRLTIFLTEQCNMRCAHCFIVKEGQTKAWEMRVQEYREFFSKASGRLSQVLFTGGEPTLRKDFSDIMVLAGNVGRCPSASIFTNGLLQGPLLKTVHRVLEETKLILSLQFSVDGPEPFHDMNRGVKGGLKKALSTIDAVCEIRRRFPGRFARINAATIVSKRNMQDLPAIIEEVEKTGLLHAFDFVRGSGVSVFNLRCKEELSDYQPADFDGYMTAEDMEKALKVIGSQLWSRHAHNLFYATNRTILRAIKDTLKERRPMADCMAGLADLILMPGGDITRCEMLKSCASLKDFNWDLTALIASKKFRDNYKKTYGCYCTHACAIGTSIMYDKDLLSCLLTEKRNQEIRV